MSYDDGLHAFQIIAEDYVKKAGYPRTYQMQIVSCTDEVLGIYKCKYQGKIISEVHSANPQMIYAPKSMVVVLVPNDDWTKEKIIIGNVNKLGADYISTAAGDELYNLTGVNCVENVNQIYCLNTNNKNYKRTIYKYDENKDDNLINREALNEYISQSSALLVGAVFKTNIPTQRQYRGHYGISFNLLFQSNKAPSEVIRSYIVDEDNMVGNPYRLKNGTRQYEIYDIDVDNFIRLDSINIFNKDFPDSTGDELITEEVKEEDADIWISNLEISGMTKMLENEINGVAISFITPQGTYFTGQSNDTTYKTITAQIKVKGKVLSTLDKIPFYWGIQNMMVTPGHKNYNKFLGRGWSCLNKGNIIQDGDNGAIEWTPANNTYVFQYSEATAKDNKIKVAAVYDGNVITKEINIKNLGNKTQITIESDQGTEFYYDTGNPNLVCKINGEQRLDTDEEGKDKYFYYWAYQSNTGSLEDLPQTKKQNNNYKNAEAALAKIQTEIDQGIRFPNEAANELNNAKIELSNFNGIQRVYKNKIYNVQINKITSFGTFKCSVYTKNGNYLGTAALTLTNILQNEGVYSLVINNGNIVYQYNEDGKSPTIVEGSLVPQTINSLTFTLYNNLGQAIDTESILKDTECSVRWKVPLKNTLIVNNKSKNESENAFTDLNYYYYDNLQNLYYEISKNYNVSNKNNQIELEVNYKGMLLTAQTNFTFVKQGDPGTNGTNYTVKIVPNTKMTNPPQFPMITAIALPNGIKYQLNYGINTTQTTSQVNPNTNIILFNAELWEGGQCIWSGHATDLTKPNVFITWQILNDPTNATSSFSIADANQGTFSFTTDNLNIFPKSNIVKCTISYQGKQYFGTIAISTAWVSDEKYKVQLKEGTGFKYVVYTTDGVNPQYDKSLPFEFQCFEVIDGVQEDISTVAGNHNITYNIITSQSSKEGELSLLTLKQVEEYFPLLDEEGKQIPETDEQGNIVKFGDEIVYKREKVNYLNKRQGIPAMRYNGECTNIGIICEYIQNDELIGWLHIPIHYLLNKYGLANLNDWDGNSIKIDDEGGYILSPQIGAGSKGSDNTFTGVLMGQVKEAGKKNSQTGLFGYASGARTFFLDSQSGGALFGKNDNGRIIINPVSDKAIIVSNNYWNKDNYDEKGFPIRLDKTSDGGINRKGAGMLIDLSTPQIKFGSGHFSVNSNGNITAQGGGTIAGWNIGTDELVGGQIHLNKEGKIYSNGHAQINSTNQGFYLAADGLSIGSKFVATNEGFLRLGARAAQGDAAMDNNPNRTYWIVNGDNSGTSYIAGPNNQVYIGTDKIALGSNFSVNKVGEMTSKSGTIGGWKIESNKLYSQNNGKRLELSPSGYIKGGDYDGKDFTTNSWHINRDGSLGGPNWKINANGSASFTNITGLSGSIGKGNQITGPYFTFGGGFASGSGGGGGGGSSLSPNIPSSGWPSLSGGTLGGGIYSASKAKFDYIYATKAEFDELSTAIANINYANIWMEMKYQGASCHFRPVVTTVDVKLNGKSISVSYNRIMALTSGESGPF